MVRFTESAGIVPHLAREEAERRHQYYLGPEHLLLGLLVEDDNPAARVLRAHGHWLVALLRDAEDPVDVDLDRYPVERRERAMFGLPDHGPTPVRLLVESHGLTLDQLRTAMLGELDQDR
jgi:hypothetical protein